MARILIAYVVPFLTPLAVYAAWVLYRSGYVARHGGEAPRFEKGPWPLLLFLGAILTLAALATTAMLGGGSTDSHYMPPHLQDGKMVPGHLEPRTP